MGEFDPLPPAGGTSGPFGRVVLGACVFWALSMALGLMTAGRRFAAGVAIGGAISVLSLAYFRLLVGRLATLPPRRVKRQFFASYAAKWLVTLIALGVAVAHPGVQALGLLLGLSAVVAGGFAEAIFILVRGIGWQASSTRQA